MIVDERMVTYIRSLERPENPVIEAIEQEALENFVPIIRKETQSFLKVMMLMNRPARVLEVGTAVGFSAILMSEYLPEGSRITTIENYEKRIPIARNNFKRAGKEEQITLIEGDALEVMKTLEGPYDFIFMDAAKGQYIHYMPEAVRLLADGGILMSDNVLQDGDIIESRFAVERRNRTIHSRMRDYLYELKHSNVLETSIRWVMVWHSVSRRKKRRRRIDKMRNRHPELLIPASSLEVLKTAVMFGADAVYIGGEAFGLRAKAKNFSMEDMKKGVSERIKRSWTGCAYYRRSRCV